MVNATNNSIYLNWNGIGTEPLLGNARVGDVMTFGTDFLLANRGDFMVLRSGEKLPEITNLAMPAKSQFPVGSAVGSYFDINSAGDVNQYRIWFQTGTNDEPGAGGRALFSVNISADTTDVQVATTTASVLTALTGLDAYLLEYRYRYNYRFYRDNRYGNGTMPSPFSISVTQRAQNILRMYSSFCRK